MAKGGQGGDHMIGANIVSQFLAGWDWVTPYPNSSQFKNNHSTEMCSGSEAGSYLTLVSLSLRLKDLLGPAPRAKKKKEHDRRKRHLVKR